MTSHAISEILSHDQVLLLLPWYVNGSLDQCQHQAVEAHVRSCLTCRRDLATERKTLKAFREESPLDQSIQAGFDRLHRRITASGATRAGTRPARAPRENWNWILNAFKPVRTAKTKAAFVAVPLTALVFAFVLTDHRPGELSGDVGVELTGQATSTGAYQTLSSASSGIANPDDLHVIFDLDTSIETIELMLQTLPAEIIAGPNSAGVSTVRLVGVSDPSQREESIRTLRKQTGVVFAEAAQPMGLSNRPETREK